MEQTITYQITKQCNSWNKESFSLPYSVKQLHISVSFLEKFRCAATISITDANGDIRLQKQLGHGTLDFCIGSSGKDTTVGGIPGALDAGLWEVHIRIFQAYLMQLPEDSIYEIAVHLTDEGSHPLTDTIGKQVWFTKEHGLNHHNHLFDWNVNHNIASGWYKGDFHTHTTLSDGKETVANAISKAHEAKLDFYVPTEHNLMHTGWPDNSLCVIPGIEITTSKGHFNLFGVDRLPVGMEHLIRDNRTPEIENHMEKIIHQAKEEGFIISINHPFLSVWQWAYDALRLSDIQCMELINDPTYMGAAKTNDKTLRFLDLLWSDGHIIYGVGGSDSHNLIEERYEGASEPSVAGDPGTYVFCHGLSPKNLLNQVKKGAICITRFCRITPEIKLGDVTYIPGQELEVEKEEVLSYTLKIEELDSCPKVFLVCNGVYQTINVEQQDDYYIAHATICVEQHQWQWIRMEVRTKEGAFLGYVNPIYHGNKQPRYSTYGDACTAMEKAE